MNKGFGRIIIGILFIGLAMFRMLSSTGESSNWYIVMALYGLFSVGHGIYMISKEKKTKSDDDALNN